MPGRAGDLEPSAAAPLQLLLRAELSDGTERATLRLTLRRWRAERFELEAADLLGRRLWSLSVAGEGGIWRDRRSPLACRLPSAGPVRLGELAVPLAPQALAAVLLGELPVPLPAGSAPEARAVEFDEAGGGRWRVTLAADGGVDSWRLTAADGASLTWERRAERRLLQATSPPFTIEWRQAARERLAQPEPGWIEPAAELPECGDEELP